MANPLRALAALMAAMAAMAVQATSYRLIDLGSIKAERPSAALAVDPRGDAVGFSSAGAFSDHAFVVRQGLMRDLGTLGGNSSIATAINALGHVVGWSDTADGAIHAFIAHEDGALVDLGTFPGGGVSLATGINRAGDVVGSAYLATRQSRAFLYRDGVMSDLGTLGGIHSAAYGINDAGQVVGVASRPSGAYRAFMFSNGTMKDLGTLGGPESCALAINQSREVTGYSTIASGESRAFLYRRGTMNELASMPHYADCRGRGLNDRAEVVGDCRHDSRPKSMAFVHRNGRMHDLNRLLDPVTGAGWHLLEARGINNAGQIVGIGTRQDGIVRAYLLTPIRP